MALTSSRKSMITANVIHRVFHIRYNGASATAFAIDVENREYLITARHVVSGHAATPIEINSNDRWTPLNARLVGQGVGDLDIAVVALDQRLTPPGLPLPATCEGLVYGQDAYFLGFPYGFTGRYRLGPSGYPLPFVKKAIVSLFEEDKYLLDGHNNQGFSGGPVVFKASNRSEFQVASIVSAYRSVNLPVFEGSRETGLSYQYNTGIVVTFKIGKALEIIASNPSGYQLS